MANWYFLCILFVFLYVLVEGILPIKGLYCQDPDTRKLYPINSTWPSESFCGNYTCKLRKKNVTQTEYAPVTKINITTQEKNKDTPLSDMATSPSEHSLVVVKNAPPTKQPVFHKDEFNTINSKRDEHKNGGSDNDRYLTESEITTITEILHTVKKSDLDAIVEIYNIAQDIFKEMDATTTETTVQETMDTINTDESEVTKLKKLKSNEKDSVSYWYEPLHHGTMKIKLKDSELEGTNSVPIAQSYTHPATYFNGPLTEKDFRKLPYYYPVSNFHRMSSYLGYKSPYQENLPYQPRPCNKHYNNVIPPWLNTPIKKYMPEQAKPQIQPMLLPYPFSYIHHYNVSAYPPNYYYNNYPWAQIEPYIIKKNYPQQYLGPYFTPVPSTSVAANDEGLEYNHDRLSNNEEETDGITNVEKAKTLPDWQTDELSSKVIEEIKANILESSKLLQPTLRKNIKLEKVGKVIKLDELTRTKRDTNNVDNKNIGLENVQYEPYIERTICESSTELGFFRMGNMTEPYPACCPQKIS